MEGFEPTLVLRTDKHMTLILVTRGYVQVIG